MSSSRSTRSVTVPSDSGRAGAVVGTTPRCTGRPCSSRTARSSYAEVGSTSRSTETPAAPAPVSSETGTSAAQQCATGVAPDSVTAANTHSSGGLARGGSTERCRWKPDAVGIRPAITAGSAGSSTCTTQVGARDPAAHVGDVVAQALGERLGQLAAGAVVGQHPVAARPLDRRGQRPRAGDLDLERAGVALGCAPRRRRGPGRAATGRGGGRCRRRPVSRHPAGCRSAPSSATSASVRPVRSRARRGRAAPGRAAGRAARRAPPCTARS